MLKQRWTNVISPCVCGVIVWKRSRKTFVMWCNLSKITPENLFSWHFIKWNILDYQICYSPKTPLHSCLRVLVKLHNICGHKILTGFCFKGASKLRKFLKKRSRRHIQDPVKCLRWIIFVKIKATWNKFRKNTPCYIFERVFKTTLIIYTEVYLQESCRCKSNAYPTLLKSWFGTF